MKNIAFMIVASLTLAATAAAKGKPAPAAAAKPGKQTIVQIVLADDGEFDLLQAALSRAGLVDALNGKGQFTVFAPTDAAFIALLDVATEEEALDIINTFEDVEALSDILLYHVTKGRRNSRSVLAAPRYAMLNGGVLTRAALQEAGVEATDITASNGIIHVINNVLVP
jgi:transforming growth factor-beta-induced protein